jgi:hypothetical protein
LPPLYRHDYEALWHVALTKILLMQRKYDAAYSKSHETIVIGSVKHSPRNRSQTKYKANKAR